MLSFYFTKTNLVVSLSCSFLFVCRCDVLRKLPLETLLSKPPRGTFRSTPRFRNAREDFGFSDFVKRFMRDTQSAWLVTLHRKRREQEKPWRHPAPPLGGKEEVEVWGTGARPSDKQERESESEREREREAGRRWRRKGSICTKFICNWLKFPFWQFL